MLPLVSPLYLDSPLQVLVFEGLLPSYYNHKKFLSFVRQLNFYGERAHEVYMAHLFVRQLSGYVKLGLLPKMDRARAREGGGGGSGGGKRKHAPLHHDILWRMTLGVWTSLFCRASFAVLCWCYRHSFPFCAPHTCLVGELLWLSPLAQPQPFSSLQNRFAFLALRPSLN